MEKIKGTSLDIVKENILKLKEIFPEAFCEDKIDFQKLKEVLGCYVEDKEERYKFEWHGKSKALRLSQTPSRGTLRPCKEESKNWGSTQNLYIEGDNLEVLKLLQKSYQSKIKMIYIDPPYNTGHDFIYKDDYKDNLKHYLEITKQVDEDGNKTSTNSETNGRYHTNWLNMMYPRLRLAKNLLTDDGVIFISIDDNEVSNLKKICDEIFGEENFVTSIVWEKVHTRKNSAKYFSSSHEYLLCYAKKKQLDIGWVRNLIPRENNDAYKNPDKDPNGPWKLDPIIAHNYYAADYTIIKPNGILLSRPKDGYFRYSEETWLKKVSEGAVVWGDNDSYPLIKRYLKDVQDGLVPKTLFDRVFAGDSASANKDIKDLFNFGSIFDYTKPVKLIKRLLQISTKKHNHDIILDFFSGSATTAQSIIQLNFEDFGNRKFIMVQFPEFVDCKSESFKAGYKDVCEIGTERIRRAGDKIVNENTTKESIQNLDIGFKVFKLDSSNIKPWNPDFDSIQLSLRDMVDNFVPNRSEEDVVYEIMLKYGIDLTYPIEVKEVNGKKVFSIGFGALIICLDNDITLDVVHGIVDLKNKLNSQATRVVFKDNGFKNDTVKTNALEILKKNNFEEVVSI